MLRPRRVQVWRLSQSATSSELHLLLYVSLLFPRFSNLSYLGPLQVLSWHLTRCLILLRTCSSVRFLRRAQALRKRVRETPSPGRDDSLSLAWLCLRDCP